MRFTLDGESFELAPGLVRARLQGWTPEEVREYWVEIDGVRWPVKQAVALATGAKRSRFQSQDARRWLHNLGFPTGTGSSIVSHSSVPRAAISSGHASFDPSALEELEALDVRVAYSWLRAGCITLDSAGLPTFPPLPRVPGVYRYDFGLDNSGIRTLYVGESAELARRASNYRNAKTDRSRRRTSRRIHREIVSHLGFGGRIEFAIATSVRWGADEELDLRLRSARRLAENAAVLLMQLRPGVRVLNIDAELGEEGERE